MGALKKKFEKNVHDTVLHVEKEYNMGWNNYIFYIYNNLLKILQTFSEKKWLTLNHTNRKYNNVYSYPKMLITNLKELFLNFGF